jgi:hypothetical protein
MLAPRKQDPSAANRNGVGPHSRCTASLRFIPTVLVLLGLAGVPATVAQDKPDKAVYQPPGAPANPKVQARWNKYHDYSESAQLLADLAREFPHLCRLQSLGKSYGSREMWLLTITHFETAADDAKPAFWIDGGIHANEIQSVEVALYTAWYLAETYSRNPMVTRLLQERTFYILPMLSPDSRDAHFYEPNSTHSPRSGQRPVDDDRDGLFDEDGPDDLDGDGSITQMRVRDPNGRWKPHPDFPDLLVPADDDQRGQFTLLGSEGIDNDDDGEINEDGDGFYDPNRDWPHYWQPQYVQRGAYRYPLSILENRLAADFILSRPNIAGAQSYHNSGGMILRGPGVKADSYETADLAVFDAIAKRGQMMLPGYRYLNVANDLYEAYGSELDWLYNARGAYPFTNELFTAFNYFRQSSDGGGFFGRAEDQQKFARHLLLEEGITRWNEVQHPKYGRIEVGGMRKEWVRQPPTFLLEEECHRNMAFTLFHADQLPLVQVESVSIKPLPGDLKEVTAVVINPKLTPTRSAIDIKRKLSPPDRITLESPAAKVLLGLTADNPHFERPAEQKRLPHSLRVDRVPAMGVVYARWLAQGTGPFTVSVQSTKGGSASKTAE